MPRHEIIYVLLERFLQVFTTVSMSCSLSKLSVDFNVLKDIKEDFLASFNICKEGADVSLN